MSTVEDNLFHELVGGASLNPTKVSANVPIVKSKAKRRNYVKKVEHCWSHDEIMRLIVAVEERRELWDFSLPQYKLSKTGAWKEVAEAIGNTTVDDAKAKWMNLRITFRNNFRSKYRSKKSEEGTAESVVIQWRYFKSMMFLEANDVQQSTESESSFAVASANSDAPAVKDFSETLPPPCVVVPGKRKRHVTPEPTPSPSPTPLNNSMSEVAFNAVNSLKLTDRFSAFGDYIASELRALPPDRVSFVLRSLNRELLRLLEAEEMPATPSNRVNTRPK